MPLGEMLQGCGRRLVSNTQTFVSGSRFFSQGNRIWIFPTLVAGRKVDSDDSPGFSKQKFASLKAL
jgi:hypothetical protein